MQITTVSTTNTSGARRLAAAGLEEMARTADPHAASDIGDRYLRGVAEAPDATDAERATAAAARGAALKAANAASSLIVQKIALGAAAAGLSGPASMALGALGEEVLKALEGKVAATVGRHLLSQAASLETSGGLATATLPIFEFDYDAQSARGVQTSIFQQIRSGALPLERQLAQVGLAAVAAPGKQTARSLGLGLLDAIARNSPDDSAPHRVANLAGEFTRFGVFARQEHGGEPPVRERWNAEALTWMEPAFKLLADAAMPSLADSAVADLGLRLDRHREALAEIATGSTSPIHAAMHSIAHDVRYKAYVSRETDNAFAATLVRRIKDDSLGATIHEAICTLWKDAAVCGTGREAASVRRVLLDRLDNPLLAAVRVAGLDVCSLDALLRPPIPATVPGTTVPRAELEAAISRNSATLDAARASIGQADDLAKGHQVCMAETMSKIRALEARDTELEHAVRRETIIEVGSLIALPLAAAGFVAGAIFQSSPIMIGSAAAFGAAIALNSRECPATWETGSNRGDRTALTTKYDSEASAAQTAEAAARTFEDLAARASAAIEIDRHTLGPHAVPSALVP